MRQHISLDRDWRFHLGDFPTVDAVIAPTFDDQSWRSIDVPHDYVLDGTYTHSADRSHAYLPVQVAWYRKQLNIPASAQGKVIRLDFDGVYRDCQVWLNGKPLGQHKSGFTPFSYDITSTAKIGEDNILTVRVDPRQFEGWWYEGGGIYRHVWLTILSPVHLHQWGTYVTAEVPNGNQGASDTANLTIQTTLDNHGAACQVVSQIIDPHGRSVHTERSDVSASEQVVQHITLTQPALWSLQTPQLYSLRTTLVQDGNAVDCTTTSFGIRTIHFDVNQGFFLNGKRVEIQGVACHQDFPAVGIAVPDSLEPWRVQQLQKAGANGWRTAHDMTNESVLDACDRMGMLVMDENRHFGDTYRHHAQAGTTADDLSDLATMIQRDRNHPSVIMWSMCNEEGLQGKAEGPHILRAMMDVVHRYDKTRPITSAINARPTDPVYRDGHDASIEDILGVNYNNNSFDTIHHLRPDKPMFGSEDCNEKTTRGSYTNDRAAGMSSAYNLSEKPWQAIADRAFIAGAYLWTGFDYKGEPNPYGWPDVSNNTGILDCCGFPKDKFFYFQSCWTTKPMVHILPSTWNWPSNSKPIRVIAFSNAKRVELFLNGKSLGSQDVPHNGHAEWQVKYEPGKLEAKAFNDGQQVATDVQETTGPASQIILSPARTKLSAGKEDTVVVAVSILDEQGRIVPNSSNRVTFAVTGGAKILGVANGNPADHDPDRADQRNAFHGRCIVVLQATNQAGPVTLTATADGLSTATTQFKVSSH
ncbi:MAG TPA: glycoside hydrolase family 2 TIM barrel-domain containing protein [Tepidisphaeraceae bacterium]